MMITVKEKAIKLISDLPDNIMIDDIMYKLYVIDKIKKVDHLFKYIRHKILVIF